MRPDRVILRRAQERDRAALNALTQASAAYRGPYRAMLDGYVIGEAQLVEDIFVLAERAGKILGYYSLTTTPAPELDLLFVANEAQGTGLGAALITDLKREAATRGIRAIKIISHPPAQAFYEKMGARVVGQEPASGPVSWARPILELTIHDESWGGG
ncbi:GNAT superfamily N-acetyltransferase [Rhodopseudomonas julia]|uniref:GNAT superfamily N-acetyltransferase n=1 Tax=Rhodopseudomonas julia TaxID=200617 RepID=A0ABU0C4L0_9BRAD|nr:GNAT family N-acetyltransferase [Rhodopseudomonas julia]MDQ0325454.1 GNAT superfamily N-acetyltransferase [Rhodopseudomonas julia]